MNPTSAKRKCLLTNVKLPWRTNIELSWDMHVLTAPVSMLKSFPRACHHPRGCLGMKQTRAVQITTVNHWKTSLIKPYASRTLRRCRFLWSCIAWSDWWECRGVVISFGIKCKGCYYGGVIILIVFKTKMMTDIWNCYELVTFYYDFIYT